MCSDRLFLSSFWPYRKVWLRHYISASRIFLKSAFVYKKSPISLPSLHLKCRGGDFKIFKKQ